MIVRGEQIVLRIGGQKLSSVSPALGEKDLNLLHVGAVL